MPGPVIAMARRYMTKPTHIRAADPDDEGLTKRDIRQLADGWTIVTADHSLSAQWEHTVLVTEDGYEILTQSAGTPPPPAFVSK